MILVKFFLVEHIDKQVLQFIKFFLRQVALFKSYHASLSTNALDKENIDNLLFTHEQVKLVKANLL